MAPEIILRDSDGVIRFPHNIKVSEKAVADIIEAVYMKDGTNFKVKQLDITFSDYDVVKGIKGKTTPRNWTDDEEKYVLLHHEDGNDAVGKILGRSNMSVHMHKANLISEFDAWKNINNDIIKDLTREETVKMFFKEGSTCDKCGKYTEDIYETKDGDYECLSCHTNVPEEDD